MRWPWRRKRKAPPMIALPDLRAAEQDVREAERQLRDSEVKYERTRANSDNITEIARASRRAAARADYFTRDLERTFRRLSHG